MKNRKSIPKTAFARVYFIDREIASGKYPNTTTLAKAYETGTATISRDIEFMRDRMNAPIEYDHKRKGYYYTEKTYRLPATFASAEDMLALGMVKNLLSPYQDTPIYTVVNQLIENITAPLADTQNPRWYEDRILVPPVPAVPFPPDIWNTITEGLKQNRLLSFEYRRSWDSGYTHRKVRPYQLLFDNGAWYLYGYLEEKDGYAGDFDPNDPESLKAFGEWFLEKDHRNHLPVPAGPKFPGGTRMYSLSRIKNIKIEDTTFDYPKSADYRAKVDGSYFGVYSSEKKRRFRIVFFNDGAMRIRERIWAADQKIKETKDGVILSFTSAQYGKVLELVLSNGRDALPLEPKELVKDWQENVRDMGKKLKKRS